jgi:ribosome assembly protein 1
MQYLWDDKFKYLLNICEIVVPGLEFSNWQVIPIDPFYQPTTKEELEENGDLAPLENLAKSYMNSVRRRKGLATETKRVEHAEK